MKTKADFEPDQSPPNSLRELVLEQLGYTSYDGKTSNPLAVQSIDELMQAVFCRIEQQALEVYHSNKIWALKQWALEHVLSDTIANEATIKMVDSLIMPVKEWQVRGAGQSPVEQFRGMLGGITRSCPGSHPAMLLVSPCLSASGVCQLRIHHKPQFQRSHP